MNKFKGMPRPNVINLNEAPDRKEYTINCFADYGISDINFIMFDRWDDKNPSVTFVGDQIKIKDIAKGTTSSHLLAIKQWLETTDDEFGVFFEDDVDFTTVQHWNFTFEEFLKRMGTKWGALHLCGVWDDPWSRWCKDPIMVPRWREYYDHGLQCYVVTRKYARKLVKFYFEDDDVIHWRMPNPYIKGMPPWFSAENNVLMHPLGFDRVWHFPLFNHNIFDFKSMNIYQYQRQDEACVRSYDLIKNFWEDVGSKLTLEEIFDYSRMEDKKYGEIVL